MKSRRRPFAVTTLFATVLLSNPLSADPVADFYKGKQIRIITGAAAGDGYDLWSRMLARYMGRHIPGAPSIIVQNMPGAGTVIAANYVFNVAAKDGTVIGSFSRSLPSQALIGRPNIQFDPRRFGWRQPRIDQPRLRRRQVGEGAVDRRPVQA
jgi:tripartite-type tricarboxylate transporter receptor subunit TctC